MKTKFLSSSLPLRFAAGLLAALIAPALFAQTEMPVPAKDSMVKHADSSFMKKAAKAGDEEIAISTVAVSRTSNPQVRELAQMIIDDHQALGAQLATLASTKAVELPAKEMVAKKWEKKSAKDFDKDYVKEMVDHHEGAVELFSKAATSDNTQIASFASQQLPMLQTHLSKSKDLLKTLN